MRAAQAMIAAPVHSLRLFRKRFAKIGAPAESQTPRSTLAKSAAPHYGDFDYSAKEDGAINGSGGNAPWPRQKPHIKLSTKLEKERLMPPRMSIESIADGLNVPERLLLFWLASGTDWQKGGITHATAQHVMIRGLIDRDGAAASFVLTDEGRAVLSSLLTAK
jgi:hypothetical protein